MSIWHDILNSASQGDHSAVEIGLHIRLSMELRYPRVSAEVSGSHYDGPVAKAVRNFVRGLYGTPEYQMAGSRVDDLIDAVTDEILAKVKRTTDLVLFCFNHPEQDCSSVADTFTGWSHLKRGLNERTNWVIEHLASTIQIGINLPANSKAVVEAGKFTPDPVVGFEERALVKGWQVPKSWERFKRLHDMTRSFGSIETDTADDGIAQETTDFGIIAESRLYSVDDVPQDQERIEMQQLAALVVQELNGILKILDQKKPVAGFPPIAWHKVWWEFAGRYSELPLQLRLEKPCCESDQELADRIGGYYPGYVGLNRLNVLRRRTVLTNKCEEVIVPTILSYVGY